MYNLRIKKLNLNKSAALVLDKCLINWKEAWISKKERYKYKNKLKKLYGGYRLYLKNFK